MSVNWNWKHKVGEVIYKNLNNNQNWKLEMFGGNMMCAFIYRFKQLDEKTGKEQKMYNFFFFANDINHVRRMLKDDQKVFDNVAIGNHKIIKFRLCVSSKEYKYSNQEMLKLAKLLIDNGYKVQIY